MARLVLVPVVMIACWSLAASGHEPPDKSDEVPASEEVRAFAAAVDWQRLSLNRTLETMRARVPGGWLVTVRDRRDNGGNISVTFYPDSKHKWGAADDAPKPRKSRKRKAENVEQNSDASIALDEARRIAAASRDEALQARDEATRAKQLAEVERRKSVTARQAEQAARNEAVAALRAEQEARKQAEQLAKVNEQRERIAKEETAQYQLIAKQAQAARLEALSNFEDLRKIEVLLKLRVTDLEAKLLQLEDELAKLKKNKQEK